MKFTELRTRFASLIHCRMDNVEFNDEEESFLEEDQQNHLHVYLRIKNSPDNYEDLYKIKDFQTILSKVSDASKLVKTTAEDVIMKKYNFSRIFGPETTQQEIFDYLVKPKILKFINGHNSTLLTYGVSSSGKTYTIVGTAAEPGLVPRSLEYIFRTLPVLSKTPSVKPQAFGRVIKLTEQQIAQEVLLKENILGYNWPNSTRNEHINTYHKMQTRLSDDPVAEVDCIPDLEVNAWITFAEIYNENIHDLLSSNSTTNKEKLKLGCVNGQTYVKDLKFVHVTSGLEAYQVLQYGLHRLNYAKTNIHDHSSRSHSIFTIWLAQTAQTGEDSHVCHFNFCDLAGAERSKKTLNVGDRLKESNNINTSLLVLGRCIAAVRKAQQSSENHLVPFRESKLTQLFQNALSGCEDICMVVNINPCRALFDETQHVLNFSAIAKDIVIEERPIDPPRRCDRLTQLLKKTPQKSFGNNTMEIETRIEELKDELTEVVCQMELEQMDQERQIICMRNSINQRNSKKLDEFKEEMEYEELMLNNNLREKYKNRLEEFKSALMKEHNLSTSDLHNDVDSGISGGSSVETICISDDESDSESDSEDTIIVVDSDEEIEKEDDIDTWRRRLKIQDNVINEHHKTICCLKKQIEQITSKYEEDLKQVIIEKNMKIEELKKRVEMVTNITTSE